MSTSRRGRVVVGGLLAIASLGAATVALADPTASFSISDDTPFRGDAVTFTADHDCAAPITCSWSGGGDLSGTGPVIEHSYELVGEHAVTLTIDDPAEGTGPPTVLTRSVHVGPTAAFGVTTDGLTVHLDASGSSDPDGGDDLDYAWSFSDEGQAAGANASYTFKTSDIHTVTLTVSDRGGGVDTASESILVNRPPVGGISVSARRVLVGQPVTFSSSFTDPDEDGMRLAWDLAGGGDFADGDAPAVTRTFTSPGVHSVRLRVVDDHDAPVTALATVEVASLDPTVSIAASPSSVLTGDPVSFTAEGVDPDGGSVELAWDLDDDGFDDGTGASTTPRTFELPGTRRIRVRATDDELGTAVAELMLEIGNRPPVADFDWKPATVERGKPVTFTSRATDPEDRELAEQSWDLDGDGDYDDAFGPSASTTFRSGGSHEVGLRVRDAHGGVGVVRLPVVLGNHPPVASFAVSPERPLAGETLELTSSSSDPDGSGVEQTWDLDGDGAYDDASGTTARLLVERPGTVAVGLRVVDDEGGVDLSRRDVEVLARGVEPQPVEQEPSARVLTPFPSVRVAGRLTARGALFRLVTVTAPRGARVAWSCRARRCKAGRHIATGRAVRIPALQREFRAGTVIEFRITRRGFVGKYSRIQVRRKRAPARRDLCLPPRGGRPSACDT